MEFVVDLLRWVERGLGGPTLPAGTVDLSPEGPPANEKQETRNETRTALRSKPEAMNRFCAVGVVNPAQTAIEIAGTSTHKAMGWRLIMVTPYPLAHMDRSSIVKNPREYGYGTSDPDWDGAHISISQSMNRPNVGNTNHSKGA